MKAAYTNDLLNAIKQADFKKQHQQGIPQVWYNRADLCRHFGITYNTLKRWERHCNFPLLELQDFCPGRYDIRKVESFLEKLKLSRA